MTEGEQNRVLEKVADQLADLLSANPSVGPSQEAAPRAASPKLALSNIPDRNPFFTGRERVLARLHQALAAQGRAALSGFGGVGKTQTAVEYAYRHSGEYAHKSWTNADSREAVASGYATIVSLLELPEAVAQDQALGVGAVQRWLSSHENWLLILDNADDLAMTREFIPPGNNGAI